MAQTEQVMQLTDDQVPVSSEASYDSVPYPSFPFRQTHPDQLYTIGKLFGLDPVKTENCRVLELGCATGGNLIPMADQLPNSQFVGVDVSGVQINKGLETIKKVGLTNIELKQLSIDDLPSDIGKFDYIISHGVYSWVPDNIQNAILQASNELLAKDGIAYVSYNTYPGCESEE